MNSDEKPLKRDRHIGRNMITHRYQAGIYRARSRLNFTLVVARFDHHRGRIGVTFKLYKILCRLIYFMQGIEISIVICIFVKIKLHLLLFLINQRAWCICYITQVKRVNKTEEKELLQWAY